MTDTAPTVGCGSQFFANQALCFASDTTNNLIQASDSLKSALQSSLSELIAVYDSNLDKPGYNPTWGDLASCAYDDPDDVPAIEYEQLSDSPTFSATRPTFDGSVPTPNFTVPVKDLTAPISSASSPADRGTAPDTPEAISDVVYSLSGLSDLDVDVIPVTIPAIQNIGTLVTGAGSRVGGILSSISAPEIDAVLGSTDFYNMVDAAIAKLDSVVDLPAQGSLISDAGYTAIYNEQLAKVVRKTNQMKRDAVYGAAGMGIGVADAALTAGLRVAEQAELEETSNLAVSHSAEKARGTRQDILAIINAELQRSAPVINTLVQEGAWKREDVKQIFTTYMQAYNSVLTSSAADIQWTWDDTWKKAEEQRARFQAYWQTRLSSIDAASKIYSVDATLYGHDTSAYGHDVSKFGVEASLYGHDVSVYNADIAAYNADIVSYRAEVDAYNAEVSAFGQEVAAYSADVSRFGQDISLYGQEISLRAQEISKYQQDIANYSAQIQGQQIRLEWAKMQVNRILQEAKDEATNDSEWNNLTLQKLSQTQQVIVQVQAAMFQAYMSAISVSFSGSGSQSVSA